MLKKEDLIIKDKNQNVIKDERIEELMSDYVYISIKKFCELKGISVRTFYRLKNLETKIIKGKKYIKVIKKELSCERNIFIDKDNKINIIV